MKKLTLIELKNYYERKQIKETWFQSSMQPDYNPVGSVIMNIRCTKMQVFDEYNQVVFSGDDGQKVIVNNIDVVFLDDRLSHHMQNLTFVIDLPTVEDSMYIFQIETD